MSTILYLPTGDKSRTPAPIDESEAHETGIRCSQTQRIAHDLRNCMSILLLAITSMKDHMDPAFMTAPRRRILEDVVGEMSRLVDEMVELMEPRIKK